MFDECYSELLSKPKYATIRERFSSDISKVHNGYFSQDKKGHLKDTKGDTQADDDTYNTIMRDKEWLLSQREIEDETGVKFGVLQLDLFAGMIYEDKREVERTVTPEQAKRLIDIAAAIAPDSENKPSAADLCKVIEENGDHLAAELKPMLPRVREVLEQSKTEEPVTVENLSSISYTETVTEEKEVTYEDAGELMEHFEKKGYITDSGKMKYTMKNALKNGTLDLPKKYEAARKRFEEIITNADRKPSVRDASKDVVVRINKQVMI